MKNFLVFLGEKYYPNGGMEDFTKDFDTLEEATTQVETEVKNARLFEWGHVYSLSDRKIVFELNNYVQHKY